MFKDTGIKGRLRLLVESESLFNDGVAAVLFVLVLTWAQATGSSQLGTVSVGRTLAFMTGGGILVGVALALRLLRSLEGLLTIWWKLH
jgi:CPA1 family monovalent cation:H+ antiporter